MKHIAFFQRLLYSAAKDCISASKQDRMAKWLENGENENPLAASKAKRMMEFRLLNGTCETIAK